MNENWCVLCIAILKTMTVEQAFNCWEEVKDQRFVYTNKDSEDMIKMRQQGMAYKAIGELYGISEGAVFKRIKYKKDRSTAMETVQ